jgi:G3E family GTPase
MIHIYHLDASTRTDTLAVQSFNKKEVLLISVSIISGFLGSGKTTLLNHFLSQDHDARIGVLVNDFGSINVDADLIVDVAGETLTLSGGCICCTIRGDLEQTVKDLLASDDPPERLVIEASGVSDPIAVGMTFLTGDLRQKCRLETIISVIDCENFFEVDETVLHLLDRQLRVADLIVMNKADLCDELHLGGVERVIRSKYPQARCLRTVQGKIPMELVFWRGAQQDNIRVDGDSLEIHVHELGEHLHHHHHDHDHTLVFETWSYADTEPMDREKLMKTLTKLPPTIYRVKGFVDTKDFPDYQVVVHVAGRRVQHYRGKRWKQRKPETTLVFIAKEGTLDQEKLTRDLRACRWHESQAQSEQPNGAEAWAERFTSILRKS